MGVYKPLFMNMTSKKFWNMGVTRELAPVLKTASSFLILLVESNGWNSCATSRDMRDAHIIPL